MKLTRGHVLGGIIGIGLSGVGQYAFHRYIGDSVGVSLFNAVGAIITGLALIAVYFYICPPKNVD
jgi:hypothetical protein